MNKKHCFLIGYITIIKFIFLIVRTKFIRFLTLPFRSGELRTSFPFFFSILKEQEKLIFKINLQIREEIKQNIMIIKCTTTNRIL